MRKESKGTGKENKKKPDDIVNQAEKKTDVKKEVISWIRMLVIVVAVVLILTKCVILNAVVPSSSMETTIMTGDRLIGFRFAYWFDDPQRGDIILFDNPLDESEIYIKRVIGRPGDTVEIRDAGIYINGSEEPLKEDYLHEEWVMRNDGMVFYVPEDSYFVMGDNRNNSSDGREWAQEAMDMGLADTPEDAEKYSYVKRDEVKAKAIFTYFPSIRMLDHKQEK